MLKTNCMKQENKLKGVGKNGAKEVEQNEECGVRL